MVKVVFFLVSGAYWDLPVALGEVNHREIVGPSHENQQGIHRRHGIGIIGRHFIEASEIYTELDGHIRLQDQHQGLLDSSVTSSHNIHSTSCSITSRRQGKGQAGVCTTSRRTCMAWVTPLTMPVPDQSFSGQGGCFLRAVMYVEGGMAPA